MNKKALVIGAARSGVALTKLLLNHDYDVVLTDNRETEAIVKEFPMIEKELEELKKSENAHLETIFGEQISKDMAKDFSFIAPSPGVPDTIPIIVEADKEGIPVYSEPEVSYLFSNTPFVAITGTNGKTTTTTLVGEIFKNAGQDSYVVGNIGDAISNYVDKTDENSVFVTEIGSFQLSRSYDFKPVGAIITNITPDHLDRHKTMENYIAAKARIFQKQDENDFIVLNLDDPIVSEMAKDSPVRKYYISLDKKVDQGAYLKDDVLVLVNDRGEEIPIITVEELGIKGPHNIQNALDAAVLSYNYGIPLESISETLHDFKGVEHRQEYVAEKDGILYINDSKGTNTDAAITALNAMRRPVILIAGGYDKKEDYNKLAEKIKEKCRNVVLLGQTADDIENTLLENKFEAITKVDSFEDAVKEAKDLAKEGDVVLLSPACASWGMFDNYEQRGNLFKELVLDF